MLSPGWKLFTTKSRLLEVDCQYKAALCSFCIRYRNHSTTQLQFLVKLSVKEAQGGHKKHYTFNTMLWKFCFKLPGPLFRAPDTRLWKWLPHKTGVNARSAVSEGSLLTAVWRTLRTQSHSAGWFHVKLCQMHVPKSTNSKTGKWTGDPIKRWERSTFGGNKLWH
jgi:hypothetical protein